MHLDIIKQNSPKTWTSGPSAFAAIILSRFLVFTSQGNESQGVPRGSVNLKKIRHQSTTATKPGHAQVDFVESRGPKEAEPGLALKSLF